MKFLLFLFSFSAYSQDDCAILKKLEDKNVSPAKSDCTSYHYYYGFYGKKGDEEARNCAYREHARGDDQFVFGGSSVLMMIYANGRGVKKDIDLALKYACLFGGSDAEIEGRIAHLKELRHKNETFDVCDDITSGYMQGHCSAIAAEKKKEERSKRLSEIQKTWSGDEKSAFQKLKSAFDRFEEARINKEVDLSGTARASFMIVEQEFLQKAFLMKFEKFENGTYPEAIPENDPELNAVFQFLMKQEKIGTITPEGIRETQREWLKFRDAWIAFAKQKYPKIVGENLLRELTSKRIEQLKELKSYYE